MGKVETIRLLSLLGLVFSFYVIFIQTNTFAAGSGSKAEGISFEVLNPEAEMIMAPEISLINPRVNDLSDKNIGLIWVGKPGGEFFFRCT